MFLVACKILDSVIKERDMQHNSSVGMTYKPALVTAVRKLGYTAASFILPSHLVFNLLFLEDRGFRELAVPPVY